MEPTLIQDPRLQDVLAELIKREPIFHHPEYGITRKDFETMTEPYFWEVGASGKRYSREYVIELLLDRYAKPHEDIWQATDFHCLELAPNNYLLTYTLSQGKEKRLTRRATIWRYTQAGWKIVYHQGTVCD